ncbi:FHA domain-containing protein [Microbacterium sp.]|uniref:FHA domain-containing protein n=1 Tax=Microbacterium sp. TaxID=51671 RepID=UPI0039E36371
MTGSLQVRYRPAASRAAGWRLAVDADAVALLPPHVSDAATESVWQRIGEGIGALVEVFEAFGAAVTAIPPFALVAAEATGIRVTVRGPLVVEVTDAAQTHVVSGEGVATWTECFFPAATGVTVAAPAPAAADASPTDAEGASPTPSGGDASPSAGVDSAAGASDGTDGMLPLRSGIVVAELLTASLAPTPAPSAPSAPSSSLENRRFVENRTVEPESVLSPNDLLFSMDVDAGSADAAGAVVDDATEVSPRAAPSDDTWISAQTATEGTTAPVSPDEYELLWGQTVARRAVIATMDAAPMMDAGAPALVTPTPMPTPVPTPTPLGDHDGETVAASSVRETRAGHGDRPRYDSTDSVPPRRPARGRIVLSTGRVVELERPVIIGRRPKSTRASAAELPTLVAVDSPEQDISRSHVEIRAEGEHVLVSDLGTTNGTVLLRRGQEPVRLHPNEPTLVISGDALDIGEGITVTFEDLP